MHELELNVSPWLNLTITKSCLWCDTVNIKFRGMQDNAVRCFFLCMNILLEKCMRMANSGECLPEGRFHWEEVLTVSYT